MRGPAPSGLPLLLPLQVVEAALHPDSVARAGEGWAARAYSRAAHLCPGHHRGRHLLGDSCPAGHEGGGPGPPARAAL